jgi:hypothetical protein
MRERLPTHRGIVGTRSLVALFGREAVLDRVRSSDAAVLVLTGDSGVGKTDVLAAASESDQHVVAPTSVKVLRRGGSLQRAVLDALAAATAELVEDQGAARRIGERLRDAAIRLARDRGSELARVLGAELLNVVKGRVGEHVGDALADYVTSLREAEDETLVRRIRAAVDPDVIDVLTDFATEVADLAEGRAIVLSLDEGENLDEHDRRLLGDLADRLPPGVRARLSVADFAPEVRDWIDGLKASTNLIDEIEIDPLDEPAVREWLEAAHVDADRASDVLRVTNGYPLFVGEAVAALASGELPETLDVGDLFVRRTDMAWNQLGESARACARRLCVLPDPLPEAALRGLCQVDAAQWAEIVRELQRARVFLRPASGTPWFHERRRDLLVERLDEDERRIAAQAAIAAVHEHTQETGELRRTAQLPELVRAGGADVAQADAAAAAVAALDRDALAVAAALIELTEPAAPFALDAVDVLRHARNTFGATGDLVAALGQLVGADLAATTTTESQVAVTPQLTSLAAATLQGRALLELGRLPLPGLGSSVFQAAIRPQLGEHFVAVHGVGRGTIAALSEMATGRFVPPQGGEPLSPTYVGDNVLLRFSYQERQLSAAVRFPSSEERDAAAERLTAGVADVFGSPVAIRNVLRHPLTIVPPDRFRRAAERALGKRIEPLGDQLKLKLDEPYQLAVAQDLRAATFAHVRTRSDEAERLALDLDEPLALHWQGGDEFLVEAEVLGGAEGAIQHSSQLPLDSTDPYRWFRMIDALGLGPDERLSRLHLAFGTGHRIFDPVVFALGRLRARAIHFNASQVRMNVLFEAGAIEELLFIARRRELEDARALADALPLLGAQREAPNAERVYVVLIESRQPDAFVAGGAVNAQARIFPHAGDVDEVSVAHFDLTAGRPDGDLFVEAFGTDAADPPLQKSGVASGVLSGLLGYRDHDVQLVRADGTPADTF